jgi:hypothetical protein
VIQVTYSQVVQAISRLSNLDWFRILAWLRNRIREARWDLHWVQVPLKKYAGARETFAMMVSAPKAKLIEHATTIFSVQVVLVSVVSAHMMVARYKAVLETAVDVEHAKNMKYATQRDADHTVLFKENRP